MSSTPSRMRRYTVSSREEGQPISGSALTGLPASALAARIATPTPGEVLPHHTKAKLEHSFDHSFGEMRIHHDASADEMSRALDARAFAAGDNLFFRSGQYVPDSSEGLQLIAHEAAHVAANHEGSGTSMRESGIGSAVDVVDANDTSERAAHDAAEAVVRGAPAVATGARAPAARTSSTAMGEAVVVQRWPWDDDTPAAPDAANNVSAPAAGGGLTGLLSSVGGAIGDAAGSAYNFEKKALTTDYNAVKSASSWWDETANLNGKSTPSAWYDPTAGLRGFHENFNTMGDGLKSGVSAATSWADDATKGNSVLNSVVNNFGGAANSVASIGSGAIKGAGDLATTTGNAFLHPIDSAIGMAGSMWNMWEHTPIIGGGLKGLHGMYDLATGNEHGKYGSSMSELNKNLSMGAQMDSDIDFWAGIGGGRDAWAQDPLEAGTRTLTNFAPMLLGMAEGIGAGGPRGGLPEGALPEAGVPAPEGGVPAPEAPLPEGSVPRGGTPTPEAPFDPSKPIDFDDFRSRNPDLVPKEEGIPARNEKTVFRDEPLPLKKGPSELDQIRVKVAEQRGGGAQFSKNNARRR